MPDGTETRIANIPGHGPITVNNVPSGMSDDDFRNQFRQRHPEYFKGTQAAPQATGTQTAQPPISPDTTKKAGFFSRLLSPENIARSSEPPANAPWYSGERIAAGGVRNLVSPVVSALTGPTSLEESAVAATGGQPAVLGKRAADASIEGVKRALAMPAVPTATGISTNTILAALNAIPVLGPYVSGIIERAPRDPLGAITDIGAGLALHGMTSEGGTTPPKAKADIAFEKHVQANRIVEARRTMVSKSIRDAEQNVKNHVGQLVRGIEGEDVRQAGPNPQPTINGAHLNDAIGDVREAFGIDEMSSPAFRQAVQKITNQGGKGYWTDYHNLKMSLRDLWSKAPEGSRQRAALDQLSRPVEDMLKDRSEEIGQSKQHQAYSDLWSKLKTFDDSGSLSDLLNLKPHDNMGFLKMINDPAHVSQLRPVAKALSQYGLDPQIFDTQRTQLGGIYKGMQSGKGKALIGAVNAIQREPVAGTIGAVLGHTMLSPAGHGFIGAILGASKAVKMAETARLASELKKVGVPPETQLFAPGVSKIQAAEPAPKATSTGGRTPPPAPSTDPISSAASRGIDIDALKGTLSNLGVKGQANITARLKEALAKNPKTTEEAAEMLAKGK